MKQKPFPDRLILADYGMRGDSRLFILENDFRFFSSKGCITVPKGFVTDGASIPRIFWNIFYPLGPYFDAAVVHDWGYSKLNLSFNKLEIDNLFLEGMEMLGVGWIQRKLIYRAVRLFGGSSYKGH
jgi:hypothetical protein